MKAKKYYLGLDAGTNSVGFCVTDENYNIIKKQGKHLWGARLFEEAETAASRRTSRCGRRRLQRRRQRIVWLQEIFAPEMNKVDKDFFTRLNNSALHSEDKKECARTDYLLFNNGILNDKSYYDKYPTIYHLKKDIIDHPEKKFDIRMIYLAIAHTIKYRGNFLMESDMPTFKVSGDELKKLFDNLNDSILEFQNNLDENAEGAISIQPFQFTVDQINGLLEVFKENEKRSDLEYKELELFGLDKKSVAFMLLQLVNGSSLTLKKLFGDEVSEDSDVQNQKIDFTTEDVEDVISGLTIEKAYINILLSAQKIYGYRKLAYILKGKNSVSEAMIETYEIHKAQLKILKKLYKEYAPKKYAGMFRHIYRKNDKGKIELNTGSYACYIGFNDVKGKKIHAETSDFDSLKKKIKADLPKEVLDKQYEWVKGCKKASINECLDANDFLPKQNSKDNSVLPYQVNANDLKAIIDSQKGHYPFLADESSDFNNPEKKSYKLISLLEYKVPYFVGTLKNGWMVRKNEGYINPWNFHEMVDETKTEEAFLENLKNPCTYLMGEPTLPSNSLLYSKYVLLNELNNYLINGDPITVEDKQFLINNVYLVTKKVTSKAIRKALKAKYKTDVLWTTKTGKEIDDQDIHASLGSYIDLCADNAFGRYFYENPNKYKLAEEVIYYITALEDKKILKKKLQSLHLSEEQIKYFLRLNYSGWGKLSRKFLDEITSEYTNPLTDEVIDVTIMYLLENTSMNLMEIYESKKESGENKYQFKNKVQKLNGEQGFDIDEIIANEYASPAMKRTLKQTYKIVEELKKILQINSFDSYFVECTRHEEKKVRTNSRKNQLREIYQVAKTTCSEFWNAQLADDIENKEESYFSSQKMFLYYLQMGRSVYTGKQIEIDDFKNYDIDHIIPQAKIKDDSILNKVLVEKEINIKKSDTYPIPEGIITPEGRTLIEALNKVVSKLTKTKLLMPNEKKDKLLRSVNNPLSDSELVGFINRQLTTTDFAVKSITDILRVADPKANVVFSRASLVSDFRKAFDIPKCRDVNDFHHAHDAYLNVVVGNVYNKVYSSNFTIDKYHALMQHSEGTKLDAFNLFARDCFCNFTTCVWKKAFDPNNEEGTSNATINTVRKNLSYNDPMVTQMLLERHGLFKITISPKLTEGYNSKLIPLKKNGVFDKEGWQTKYGSYTNAVTPYFMLVESLDKKNKKIYSIENIPNYRLKTMEDTSQAKEKYYADELHMKSPRIIIDKILINTVIRRKTDDGISNLVITGNSGGDNQISTENMSQICLPRDFYSYCAYLSTLLGTNTDLIDKNKNKAKYESLLKFGNDNIFVKYTKSVAYGRSKEWIVTKERNEQLFDFICDVLLKETCFRDIPAFASSISTIVGSKEKFSSFETVKQAKVLIGILNAIKTNYTDIKDIGSSYTGGKLMNKVLTPGTQIVWKSVTGFYTKILFEVPKE